MVFYTWYKETPDPDCGFPALRQGGKQAALQVQQDGLMGWCRPSWTLAARKRHGQPTMSGHGKCTTAGTALHSATWFYPGGGQSPMLMREKSITTAFAIKTERQFEITCNFANWWVTPLVLCLET